MGERDLALQKREVRGADPVQVDTFGGRLHVEWDTDSSVTTGSMRVSGAVALPRSMGTFGVIDLLAGSLHRRPDSGFDPGRQTKSAGITRHGSGVTAVFRII
jgi:hypothetical protein